jgi:hypothetical protein
MVPRIVGTGCVALAAMYTVSLAFWWPRGGELASIAVSSSGDWLLRLLALKLIADTLLVIPTAFVGLRCLAGGRHNAVVWIVGAGLLANMGTFASYLTSAIPLYLTEGAWIRFGPQNDFGVRMAAVTLTLQLMLLLPGLRRLSASAPGTLATSH